MLAKLLLAGGAVVGVGLAGKRCAAACRGLDFEKMLDRMPENAPPRWMFRNIEAIRENTERILRVVEHQPAEGDSVHKAA